MLQQVFYTVCFYFGVVAMFRLAGKRLAGQTTTFDLMVLIALIVTLQGVFLLDGRENKVIFVVTGFLLHLGTSWLCARSKMIRCFLRGKPVNLVQDGEIIHSRVRAEGLSVDELRAGIRKAGIEKCEEVKTAYLEETGQISAIRK